MRIASLLFCALLVAGCKVDADFSDAVKVDQLRAEEYEDEIASVDRIVFGPSPLSEERAQKLEQILTAISKRVIAANKGSRWLKLESLEMQLLAKRAPRLPAATLQDNWMRIRNNLFDDRAWFVRSANDLDYAAGVVPDRAPILNGRWRAVSILANGQPREDPEISGSIWTFDLPQLVIEDGRGKKTTYSCGVEDGYFALVTPSGDQGFMKYERAERELHVAFFDGLKGMPQSFEPQSGQPLLVLVILQRD